MTIQKRTPASVSQPARQAQRPMNEGGFLAYGQEIIRHEAQALQTLADSLDGSFDSAVRLMLEIPANGRVVVSGMGKAGFIGMKISATLASIGVPSFFLHPAEAVHGDLGRFQKGDLALVLSNSGETDEVLRFLPFVRRVGCPVISLTMRPDSHLGKMSDVVLAFGKLEEVGPTGLAPTTSTTAMLALGDALAMAVGRARGFTESQFAVFHPSGNIGRLLLPIRAVMRQGDEVCIVSDVESTREVIHRITGTKGRPGAAAVVDAHGKLVGIFTDGNLRRAVDSQGGSTTFLTAPVRDYMSPNPRVVLDTVSLQDALNVLTEFKIDQVLVVDGKNRPVGLVDIQDVY